MPRKLRADSESATTRRSGGGRPPKFAEPRRPVTITLPERTLEALSGIDADRARAIVKLADSLKGSTVAAQAVEIVPIGGDAAVIVLGRSRSLARIPWIRQIEIGPGRYLISVEPGTPIDTLEVALVDLLDTKDAMGDRRIIEELLAHVRGRRRDQAITKEEILVIRGRQSKRSRSRTLDGKTVG